MKKEFQTVADRPRIIFTMTRDSVCAGDDCDAPHQKTIEEQSFTDPKALSRHLAQGYLPSVSGNGHTWVCSINKQKIAVLGTQGIDSLVDRVTFDEENVVHFTYRSACR